MFNHNKNTVYLYMYENNVKTLLAGYIQVTPYNNGYCMEIHTSIARKVPCEQCKVIFLTTECDNLCGFAKMKFGKVMEKHYLPIHNDFFIIENRKINCSLIIGISIQIDKNMKLTGYSKKPQQESKILYPTIKPFGDESAFFVIKIKDCEQLFDEGENLIHNSFLLHGFYNYRHLILGPCDCIEKNESILGVPGAYYERELTVARMFGFEKFVCMGRTETAKYGYYTKEVALKNNMIYK